MLCNGILLLRLSNGINGQGKERESWEKLGYHHVQPKSNVVTEILPAPTLTVLCMFNRMFDEEFQEDHKRCPSVTVSIPNAVIQETLVVSLGYIPASLIKLNINGTNENEDRISGCYTDKMTRK